MVARVNTVAFQGVDVRPVDVQVQISSGLPAFTIVGLPDKAVAESKERVRAALHALGMSLPPKRLTVNLAPADVAKEGSHYDLPIALGLLAAMGVIPKEELEQSVVLGELGLDSSIRAVAGILPAAVHAGTNDNRLICPQSCGGEAAWAGDIDILAPRDLLQLINHIKGSQVMGRPEAKISDSSPVTGPDLADVKGQEMAKRALEITAAGGHNLLMIGPPGSGKSMLASCLPGILPPLTPREALEVSMVHSLAGSLPDGGLITKRPFRDPHHSASLPALIGGGHKVKPGEVSLAHNGVLFLDELPELWNVLKGEMSFVGPRPVTRVEMKKYGFYRTAYLSMRPGITGLWQVSGRNDVSYDERVRMDVQYLSDASLANDLKLILGTGMAVLGSTGR